MLKMIIADDEIKIREGMKNCIDWEILGIQITGLCKNGLEAYDMILDESPDIVLTDIKMPALSGLELIKRITQSGQHIEFIILSGYGEFSYTKEAMKYGIKHYLLKPCNEEELVSMVKEAAEACYEWKKSCVEQQHNAQQLYSFRESIFRNLLVECLFGSPDYLMITEQYEQYINFSNMNYEMLVISNVEENKLQDVVIILREWKEKQMTGIPMYCLYIGTQIIVFFEGYRQFEDAQTENLVHRLPAVIKIAEKKSFLNLSDMLPKIRQMIASQNTVKYLNNGRWIRLYVHNTVHDMVERLKEKMGTYMQQGTFLEETESLMNAIQDPELLKTALTSIFITIFQKQREPQAAYRILEYLAKISAFQDMEQIRSYAMKAFSVLIHENGILYTGKHFIDHTIQYVYENLSNPELSLKLIAETQLFMNVDYLSKQFSRYVGCKFSVFLAQARLDEAKRLLLSESDISVQDVAIAVGCGNNPQYFSFLFKKHTGLTATDYVKRMRNKL